MCEYVCVCVHMCVCMCKNQGLNVGFKSEGFGVWIMVNVRRLSEGRFLTRTEGKLWLFSFGLKFLIWTEWFGGTFLFF